MNLTCILRILLIPLLTASATAQEKPYRLESVDLKQPIIWGTEIKLPDGTGLAFGGQDQTSETGRPHTRILQNGKWKRIDAELRANNPLQKLHEEIWGLRNRTKDTLSKARRLYFKGLPPEKSEAEWNGSITPELADVLRGSPFEHLPELSEESAGFYYILHRSIARNLVSRAIRYAQRTGADHKRASAKSGPTPKDLANLLLIQLELERAAEATAAEPPARALACDPKTKSRSLVYEPKSKKYILFGGDHLDYLTNDLWIFDPTIPRWEKQHPPVSPPPRANHHLSAPGDGTIRMTGGYTYASNTDYVGGQYIDLNDGEWIYHLEKNSWSRADGKAIEPTKPRTYRTGPYHPDHFLGGDRPTAAAFQKWLSNIPTNEWVATDPPFRPRLNRDWGTARLDPDRDLILRWSGGHSAHGGTDVPHFHLATNRWELPFPVEFPLGQLYSNTSYPNGYNFNLRPWVTGHTYQNYAYDIPSKTMVFTGRPNHFYIYDPDKADWVSRGKKPEAMCYNSCFYTLTLTSTPHGALCWDKNGAIHLFDSKNQTWNPIETTGANLPGAYVDNSSIVYDSKRDRAIIVNTPGYNKPYTGQIWALDLKSHEVTELSPTGMEQAHRLATIDKSCYDPLNDLILFGTYLKDAGDDHTPQPAYDCAENRWVTLDLKYQIGERYGKAVRQFPHTRSDALIFDPKRKLIWGVDTNGQVYVLRLDKKSANPQPLKEPGRPAPTLPKPNPPPDISSVEPDLTVPEVTDGDPKPGARVRQKHLDYAETKVFHTLYLPTDWKPGRTYPVIVEYAGNGPYKNAFGDISTGHVEGSKLGYGLTAGEGYIWLCLPYLNNAATENVTQWWGNAPKYNPIPTVEYAKKVVPWICKEYGGNPDKIILTGFSRGAIACNFIGLHDDEISTLWSAFIPYSHYDGVIEGWPYPGADRASALKRLKRLGSRPQFILHEGTGTAATNSFLESTGIDLTNLRFLPTGFRNHNDAWLLRPSPARTNLRTWLSHLPTRSGGVPAP